MRHSFVCAAFAAALVVGLVYGRPMSSSVSKLSPRYTLGAWPGHTISNEAQLFLNLVQVLFRGVFNKILPPVINTKECTPVPLGACCPAGWTQIGSSCYTVLPPQTLSAARLACAVGGRGHLLAINSYDENIALQAYLKNETCDTTGCLVGWSDQYDAPHTSNGNSDYVTYQTPCAGAGLVKVEVQNGDANLPCNIVYAGTDDISKAVLDQISCTGPNTSAMIAVCELELDGDPSHYTLDWATCVAAAGSR